MVACSSSHRAQPVLPSVSAKCGDSKQHLEASTPINIYDEVREDKNAGCP